MRSSLLALGAGAIGLLVANACKSTEAPVEPGTGPFGADVAVTSYVHVGGLGGPVDVVRDAHGMVHIYATTLTDAVRAEGYQMAHDRTVQLELYRRVAEGRTAELLGDVSPDLIDDDITMRTIGLHRAAKAMYAQYAPGSEMRDVLDAFADGVSQFNSRLQSGAEHLPNQVIGLSKKAFEPWTGVDALAIARLQTQNLAYSAEAEVALQRFVDAARDTFAATSPDPLLQKRSGILVDVVRFAPLDPTTPLDGFPDDAAHTMKRAALPSLLGGGLAAPVPTSVHLARGVGERTAGWSASLRHILATLGRPPIRGSNDWVVSPGLTATGHAMLANDPHLSLSAPSVFYMVHLDVTAPPGGDPSKDVHAAGMAFPGIPGVVLGFNRQVSWGATTADYDVTDVYTETLSADGAAVTFKGQAVPLVKVHETIGVAGGANVEYDVLEVPHHGPLIPTIVSHAVVPPAPGSSGLSIKWTGAQATDELGAFTGYMRARNVEDARVAVRSMGVGAQNFVFADTAGDIFYSTQSLIPKRDRAAFRWDAKTFTGNLPCLVLPGDGTAEWTGEYLPEAYVPHVKNPARGFLATANGDQVGVTLDDDPSNDLLPSGEPVYLGCFHDPGLRVGRIVKRIASVGHPMTLDDMASIQADARSNMGALLAPKLAEALAHAEAERASAGAYPDLAAAIATARYGQASIPDVIDTLTRWGTESDYDAAAGVSLENGSRLEDAAQARASTATLIFNAWVVQMFALTLGDELAKMGDPPPTESARRILAYLMTADRTKLATYDPVTGDSALFDDLGTPAVESRDERAVTALLDALDFLTTKLGADRAAWRWGTLHTLRFESLVSLWGTMSIPPVGDPVFPAGFPRHGDGYDVDVGSYDDRPASLGDLSFAYREGPVQRLVIDMDPAGPVARNAIPGGEVWDPSSKHFRDEAELWRRNQNDAVPFAKADVVKSGEEHVVLTPGVERPVSGE